MIIRPGEYYISKRDSGFLGRKKKRSRKSAVEGAEGCMLMEAWSSLEKVALISSHYFLLLLRVLLLLSLQGFFSCLHIELEYVKDRFRNDNQDCPTET
ncbi:hypothetical protein BDZ91DRAFT_11756 [Kalaharituber pfeilii]|nr:hypothetical protein BDZ91DRAFT_11756 [Kalaharituber pfeilii]